MLRSMTGFSKTELELKDGKLYGEARSLNSRYLEINVRLQRPDYLLEQKLREVAKKYLRRGRVDVAIKWERLDNYNFPVKVNENAVSWYLALVRELKEKFGLEGSLDVETILSFRDVIVYEEQPFPQTEKVLELFEQLLLALDAERRREGKIIEEELQKILAQIESLLQEIENHLPEAISFHEKRLKDRLKELVNSINEDRILEETFLYIEKHNMAEEICRLRGHIENFKNSMKEDCAIGRKLEFITQEMLREANALGSKSPDYFISERVISIKVEIEKLREQLQNVE